MKPSLSQLMSALKGAEKRTAKAEESTVAAPPKLDDGAPAPVTVEPAGTVEAGGESPPAPLLPKARTTAAQLEALRIRQFITALLKPENKYNAAAAYRSISPNCTPGSARTMAIKMLAREDVLDELDRQLKTITAAADLNEEWVYRQWRAIANADVFDLLNINEEGVCKGFIHHPDDWSKEQRLTVRRITFHPDGRLRELQLVDREKAVELVARARRMFMYDEAGNAITDMANLITQRMQAAAKRTGRTFDAQTGEILNP